MKMLFNLKASEAGTISLLKPAGAILEAGDHNGSTFYQHQRFLDVVRGRGSVEVGLEDGIWAVRMGQAAQQSAATGKTVTF